ncbi:probable 4-coumarate--CoA ligase 1 [Agrilus planipennis]|uniref:Luciferin 4-monooxygenase n=1 Tax=Agrilus planipennis TaxID=224129 RepID=A0A1W4WIR9_AGRPL|nr:probable 4-coumarate--CoA ligase 1 [Agrilus planipennis]
MITTVRIVSPRVVNLNKKYLRKFLSTISNSQLAENVTYDKTSGIVTSPYGKIAIPNENLVEFVWKRMEEHMEHPVTTCAASGRSYTFGMMRLLINRFAQALLGHCGMKPGEVVGLLLPNIPEYVIASHGSMEAGLTVTFVNPLYTPDEVKRQFQNAGVKMIITIPLLLEVATNVGKQLPDYKTTVCIGGEDDLSKNVQGFQSLLEAGHESDLPGINPQEIALLPYSSGTTGLPKGVMLSHYNLVANLAQGEHPSLLGLEKLPNKQDVAMTVLPFFHIYGFNGILNVCLKEGIHLVTLPRFTPEDYIKALVKYRPQNLFVVPSLLLFLASNPAVTREHLSSIKNIMSGAAPATEGLIYKFKEKLGRDDVIVRQGYGMTESSPVSLLIPVDAPKSKIGTAGLLYPGTEAKVINVETEETLGPNNPGELLIRGPQVMSGYLNNEKATAETVDEDGWLHTGDIAYYDEDGYFFIVDRCKELIKVKGNQVSPTELENVILEIPGVLDVAVVGIPDALAGEVPRAFVVKKPNSHLKEQDVLEFVNSKVARYKKLAGGVKFLDTIPRNPSGKILRHELKIVPM